MEKQEIGSLDAMKTVYYVIIGWAIANALLKWVSIDNLVPMENLWDIIFRPISFLLLAFLFTVIRFCQGSTVVFRIPGEGIPVILEWWGFILQAMGFFMSSLYLKSPLNFLIVFFITLFIDFFWLICCQITERFFSKRPSSEKLNRAFKQWTISDVVFIIALLAILVNMLVGLCRSYSEFYIFLVAFILMIWDYWYNKDIYIVGIGVKRED